MDISRIVAMRGGYVAGTAIQPKVKRINFLVNNLGKNVDMATPQRNYAVFNMPLVNELVSYREEAVPVIEKKLAEAYDEKTISEGLYVYDRMLDAGVKGIDKTYGTISRFNSSQSPTVQVLLSGIYRKTQVPDAFGPLCRMLVQTSQRPVPPVFDPSEEIGGAILEYIRNYSSQSLYKQNADAT